MHWGEAMVNTSATALVDHTRDLLHVFTDTASVSLYVAHGGTNFGFWAGASRPGHALPLHVRSLCHGPRPMTPTLTMMKGDSARTLLHGSFQP